MKFLFTAVLFILMLSRGLGQQILVSGRVLDVQRGAVPFAAVALLAAPDSAVVETGQANAQGAYQFKAKPGGKYRVMATAAGFGKGKSTAFAVGHEPVRVPDLVLSTVAQVLGEVQVVGRKPLLEMQAGKMVVNVAGSLTAGATALEALQKVPGLVVMSNRISLAGREGVIIQIDGRTTQYTDVVSVLKDFPSSSIERIEVLTQPGASHDAAGNAGIINIILSKNADLEPVMNYWRVGRA